MKCPKCGKAFSAGQKFCTGCGSELEQPVKEITKKKRKLTVVLVAVFAALILLGAGAFGIVKLMDGIGGTLRAFAEERLEPTAGDGAPDLRKEDTQDVTEEPNPTEEPVKEEPPEEVSELQPEEVPEEAPVQNVVTTIELISHRNIEPLIEEALQVRGEADAKWDFVEEIPGACEYVGFVYMEDPAFSNINRLYLVFLMNATIKDTPIQFVYWTYFDDVAFDEQGNISYTVMGTAKDDGYTVKTGFGSYYSYYGLDSYALFEEYIIGSHETFQVAKRDMSDNPIEHPVSDTY